MTATFQCNKKECQSLKRKFKKQGVAFSVVRVGSTYWITA